jgi:hypothetical protein
MSLSAGNFEQPDSLRLALINRDRLAQALGDLQMGDVLRESFSNEQVGEAALNLVNSAWGWTARAKSK